ncbi:MAG TPA: DUF2171 domain-containing protein [Thermomicrobiales bacterium]
MADEQSKGEQADVHGVAGEAPGVAGGEVRATVTLGSADERPVPQHPLGPPPTTLTMPASQHVGGTERVTIASVRENMLLVGTDGETLGAIDGPGAGNTVALKPDTLGQRHWIPLDWIARVGDQAQLDRSVGQARQEWATSEPTE